MIWREIEGLRDAGLIKFRIEGETEWGDPHIEGPIRVTPAWERIQRMLGISLAQIAELDQHDDLVVRPFFERPDQFERKRDLFVLMPFSESLRAVYHMSVITERVEKKSSARATVRLSLEATFLMWSVSSARATKTISVTR
jgi:hypothetical protein